MINWKMTRYDMLVVRNIVTRALADFPEQKLKAQDLEMDITAAHLNGCPLDLSKLLAAPMLDFAHDIFGIQRHIDRNTGKLLDCFLPRSSVKPLKISAQ
jgi:hypothetical protein